MDENTSSSESGLGTSNISDDCSSPYDSYPFTIVAAISSTAGFLSFLACIIVIFVIVLYKKYLFFIQRLILYLATTALVNSLVLVLHIAERFAPIDYCVFAAFISQVAAWSELMAITCITVNVLVTVTFHRVMQKLEKTYFVLIFVFPLSFNWIPFINESYGNDKVWCWIRSRKEDCSKFHFGALLQQILWYFPLYVILVILTVMYVHVFVKLNRDRHRWKVQYDPTAQRQKKHMQREIRPLLWFPLIYLLSNLFPLINRIQNTISSDPVITLWIITAVTFPLQGVFIALAFILDPDTFKRLKWPEFKAAVKRLWQEDMKEYHMKEGVSDSFRAKDAKVFSEATRETEYVEMKAIPLTSGDGPS